MRWEGGSGCVSDWLARWLGLLLAAEKLLVLSEEAVEEDDSSR